MKAKVFIVERIEKLVAMLRQTVKRLMAVCLSCYFELTEFTQPKMNLIALIDRVVQVELETYCHFRLIAA